MRCVNTCGADTRPTSPSTKPSSRNPTAHLVYKRQSQHLEKAQITSASQPPGPPCMMHACGPNSDRWPAGGPALPVKWNSPHVDQLSGDACRPGADCQLLSAGGPVCRADSQGLSYKAAAYAKLPITAPQLKSVRHYVGSAINIARSSTANGALLHTSCCMHVTQHPAQLAD